MESRVARGNLRDCRTYLGPVQNAKSRFDVDLQSSGQIPGASRGARRSTLNLDPTGPTGFNRLRTSIPTARPEDAVKETNRFRPDLQILEDPQRHELEGTRGDVRLIDGGACRLPVYISHIGPGSLC